MKFDCIIFKILVIAVVLILSSGCASKDEIEQLLDDPYDYSGTWIGQTGPTSFLIATIARTDEGTHANYALSFTGYIVKKFAESPESVNLDWQMNHSVSEATGDKQQLIVHAGLNIAGPGGVHGTMGGQILKREGKFLTVDLGVKKIKFRLKRVSSLSELNSSAKKIKTNVENNLPDAFTQKYPHANVSIKSDGVLLPKKVVKLSLTTILWDKILDFITE